jgi:hypothetical protein
MAIKVEVPQSWLGNEGFDLHILNQLKSAGVPVVKMNHLTPVIDPSVEGTLTDEIVGQNLVYTWEGPTTVAQVDPRDAQVALMTKHAKNQDDNIAQLAKTIEDANSKSAAKDAQIANLQEKLAAIEKAASVVAEPATPVAEPAPEPAKE